MKRPLLTLVAVLLAGCANLPEARDPAIAARIVQWPAERQIVVTVRNGTVAVAENVGSTGKHYGALGRYQASPAALRDAAAIARRHGLQQVAAWPIEVLGVHCVVYAVDDSRRSRCGARRSARGWRRRDAQPLRTFHMQSTSAPGRSTTIRT